MHPSQRVKVIVLTFGLLILLGVLGLFLSYNGLKLDNFNTIYKLESLNEQEIVKNKVVIDTLFRDPEAEKVLSVLGDRHTLSFIKVSTVQDPNTTFMIINDVGIISWVTENPGEQEVQRVFTTVLAGPDPCSSDELVLDIGANAGWFGLYASAKGCRVRLFDPQPTCGVSIRAAILLNGFKHTKLMPHPVGINNGTMGVSLETGCGGRFPQSEFEKGNANLTFAQQTQVTYLSIDNVFRNVANLKLIKIDTEGAEYFVLESMLNLLKRRIVENIVVETTPIFWPNMNLERITIAKLYVTIFNFGYKCSCLLPAVTFTTSDQLYQYILSEPFIQSDFHFARDPLFIKNLA